MLFQKHQISNRLDGKQRNGNQRGHAGNTAQADPLARESPPNPPHYKLYVPTYFDLATTT